MTRRRLAGIVAGSVTALVAILALAGVLVVRSGWFREQVRQRLVVAVATATGGRVEIGTFTFDWSRLRAEAGNFTIHGTEPADKPPLFHATSVALELKIVSLFKWKVDLAELDVVEPRVYLIVSPDGRTNVPEPKAVTNGQRHPVETVLNLAIGRFSLQHGVFEVESRGKTPFDIRGRSLNANLAYERAGRRYRGNIAVQPLDLNIQGYAPTPVNISADLTIDKDRILIESAKLQTGDSQFQISGAVEDLTAPRVSLQYEVRASQADVARFLRTKLLESGTAQVTGHATWAGAGNFSATGVLHANNLEYRDAYVRLRGFGRPRGSRRHRPAPVGVLRAARQSHPRGHPHRTRDHPRRRYPLHGLCRLRHGRQLPGRNTPPKPRPLSRERRDRRLSGPPCSGRL